MNASTQSTRDFHGTHTAIVTPFNKSGLKIDYPILREIIEFQVTSGVQGVIPVGTTGESSTLSVHEHLRVISETIEQVNERILVIGGIGSNNTKEAVFYAKQNESMGANAGLSVVPYYNKPNQEGLYRHFRTQAESTSLPIILYSIPSRCGSGIELSIGTIIRLAKDCPNIVGIKEAGGNLMRFQQIHDTLSAHGLEKFQILSGDDGVTLETIKMGSAHGVISVASNIIPKEISTMVTCALNNDFARAEKLMEKYKELFHTLFMINEPNPQSLKYILSKSEMFKQRFKNSLRLPLVGVGPESATILDAIIQKYNL